MRLKNFTGRTMHRYTNQTRMFTIILFSFFILLPLSLTAQATRISKGDIIEIRVYGHDELSRTVMVQEDGTVDFPLVPNIPIDGLSLDEFRQVLAAQVTKYTGERPILSVGFSQTLNISITVLGQVFVPGEYMVAKKATVQGAITRAGGLTPRAELETIRLYREGNISGTPVIVNLRKFFTDGEPSILPPLEEGDVIVVPGFPGTNDVKVLGEVRTPGDYQVFTGANLIDALYLAGGPTEDAALKKIRLVSPLAKTNREIKIDINALLKTDRFALMPEVQAGDIIYVPKKVSFMNIIRDVITIMWPVTFILYATGVLDVWFRGR